MIERVFDSGLGHQPPALPSGERWSQRSDWAHTSGSHGGSGRFRRSGWAIASSTTSATNMPCTSARKTMVPLYPIRLGRTPTIRSGPDQPGTSTPAP